MQIAVHQPAVYKLGCICALIFRKQASKGCVVYRHICRNVCIIYLYIYPMLAFFMAQPEQLPEPSPGAVLCAGSARAAPQPPCYASSFCSLQPAWSSAAPRFPLPPVCRHAELHAASCSPAHPDTKSCAAAASAQLLRVGEGGRVPREGQRGEGGRCCLVPFGAASWHRGAILSRLLVVFKGTAFNPTHSTRIPGVPEVV